MRRSALYSRSPQRDVAGQQAPAPAAAIPAAEPAVPATPRPSRFAFAQRHERWLTLLAGLLIGALIIGVWMQQRPTARALTQKDIDGAVLHTLATQSLPSRAAKAYEAVRPSVVKVIGSGYPDDAKKDDAKKDDAKPDEGKADKAGKDAKAQKDASKSDGKRADAKPAPKAAAPDDKKGDGTPLPEGHPPIGKGIGIGTGVVIVDSKGIILTNLHVVLGATKITVVFFDGMESEATVIGVQPEHDLAVLKASKLPDDLKAAVLRSTQDLAPGDEVVAVGFPFGIGPSASAGIISGLKREYRSPEGKRLLTNLIQFDAAANPGNSGGPLVTMDGEVVGIVTAILNPTDQRVFVGIGFAVPIENAASAVGMSPF